MTRRLTTTHPFSWTTLTIAVAIIAALKGVRLPSLWAATQLQLDYSAGFLKRGAMGSLFHLLHIPIERYWVSAGVSYGFLALTIMLFVLFLRRAWRTQDI